MLSGSGPARSVCGRRVRSTITKCRGTWYQIALLLSGRAMNPIPSHGSTAMSCRAGWAGLNLEGMRTESADHPGDFQRRSEQLDSYARWPDGGCGESCAFMAVAEGRARVEYELEANHAYRMLGVGWPRGEEKETLERNMCPHTDLPISFYPGSSFVGTFPGRRGHAPDRAAGLACRRCGPRDHRRDGRVAANVRGESHRTGR
jgi:hypothetical protein